MLSSSIVYEYTEHSSPFRFLRRRLAGVPSRALLHICRAPNHNHKHHANTRIALPFLFGVCVCRCRHGESQWNLENRFTGWYNIQLSPKGEQEAAEGGKLIHEAGYKFGKRASTRAGFDCVAVGALAKCAALIATRGSVFSDPDVSSSRTCVPARAVSGISCSFTNKRDRFLLDMFSDLLFATEAFFLELSFSAASEPNVSITAPTPSQSNSAVLRHAARSQWRCSFSRTTGAVDHCCTASPFQSPLVMRTRIKYGVCTKCSLYHT